MSRTVIDIIRKTLDNVEQSANLPADDPALQKLHHQINDAIIKLEISKTISEMSESLTPEPGPSGPEAA